MKNFTKDFIRHICLAKNKGGNSTIVRSDKFFNLKTMALVNSWTPWLTPAHLISTLLLVIMFLSTFFLALQYAFQYYKYSIAEDLDSLTDNSGMKF